MSREEEGVHGLIFIQVAKSGQRGPMPTIFDREAGPIISVREEWSKKEGLTGEGTRESGPGIMPMGMYGGKSPILTVGKMEYL